MAPEQATRIWEQEYSCWMVVAARAGPPIEVIDDRQGGGYLDRDVDRRPSPRRRAALGASRALTLKADARALVPQGTAIATAPPLPRDLANRTVVQHGLGSTWDADLSGRVY